jgi:D-alanyl-lipoteichoic acid acyltransferase DltB (MBOAT superfamily)
LNFASLQFAQFLILLWVAYWLVRRREAQNWLLLGASYYFYACWDYRFLALIWFFTVASHAFALRVARTDDEATKKRLVVVYACIALALLGVFKYLDFFIAPAQVLLSSLGLPADPHVLAIVLPAGISFYTFESLSYVMDVRRGHIPATKRLRDYALFIAYFPKLVAGPIERPSVLIPQIETERRLTLDDVTRGGFLILLGLFKKIAVADGLAGSVDSIFGSARPPTAVDIAAATVAFAFQIYCDFSGYTDIARGVSKLFGIELSLNFRFPYFSSSPSEFWRRWHISLSTWLRDYLYIPLGGNRGGPWRTRKNLMVTMALGGLWHGAAWNYVLWGIYQGLLLIVYQFVPERRSRTAVGRGVGKVVAWLVFSVLMLYGWLLFRAHSLEQIVGYTTTLFTGPYGWQTEMKRPPLSALLGVPLLMLHDLAAYRTGYATFYRRLPAWAVAALYAALVFVTLVGLANARSAFIYFQF